MQIVSTFLQQRGPSRLNFSALQKRRYFRAPVPYISGKNEAVFSNSASFQGRIQEAANNRSVMRMNFSHHPIRSFSSTAPLLEQENDYHTQILEMTKTKPVNFQAVEDLLGSIEQDTNVQLSETTFFKTTMNCSNLKTEEAAEAAERFVFDWMLKFHQQDRLEGSPKPNTFLLLIQAWMKLKNYPDSGKRAEQVLDRMEELARGGNLPFTIDAPIYDSCTKAYAKVGDVASARAIFDRGVQEFRRGNENAKPNERSLNTLLNACQRSDDPEAWKVAEDLLEQMQEEQLF